LRGLTRKRLHNEQPTGGNDGVDAPTGWADCDGQLMSISQNTASLLGTAYGGNGKTTFALPDMRGRVPIHVGVGTGLRTRVQGEVGGEEIHTLTVAELPSHNHAVAAPLSSCGGPRRL
jgi:microcystin-dependent protein